MVHAVLAAAQRRASETHKDRVAQGWLTARLGLLRGGDFPDLDELLADAPERRAMSDDEIGHNIALWSATIEPGGNAGQKER